MKTETLNINKQEQNFATSQGIQCRWLREHKTGCMNLKRLAKDEKL